MSSKVYDESRALPASFGLFNELYLIRANQTASLSRTDGSGGVTNT